MSEVPLVGGRERNLVSLFFNWLDPSRSLDGDLQTTFADPITGKRLAVPEPDIESSWKAFTELLKQEPFESVGALSDFLYDVVVFGNKDVKIGLMPSGRWEGVRLKDRAVVFCAAAFALSHPADGIAAELRVRCLVDEFPLEVRALISEIGEKLGSKWQELNEAALRLADIVAAKNLCWSGESWQEKLELLGDDPDYSTHPLHEAGRVGLIYAGSSAACDQRLDLLKADQAAVAGTAAAALMDKFHLGLGLVPEQVLWKLGDLVLIMVPVEQLPEMLLKIEKLWHTSVGTGGYAAVGHVYSLMQLQYGFNHRGNFDDLLGHLRRLHQERVWGCPQPGRIPPAIAQVESAPFVARCVSCRVHPSSDDQHGLCRKCSAAAAGSRGRSRAAGVLCVQTGLAGGRQWSGGIADWLHFNERIARALGEIAGEAAKQARGRAVPFWCGDRVFIVLEADQMFETSFRIADHIERVFAKQPAPVLATGLERYAGGYEYSGAATPSVVCGIGLAVTNAARADAGAPAAASLLASSALRLTVGIGRSAFDYCLTSASCLGSPASYKRNFLEKKFQTQEGAQAVLGLSGRPYSLIEMQGLLRSAMRLKQADIPAAKLHDLAGAITAGKTRGTLEYLYMRARAGRQKDVFKTIDEWWHGSAGSPDPYRAGRVDGRLRYETYLPDIFELSGFLQTREEKEAPYATVQRD